MKKLKSEFKKDETMTQNLKIFFDEVIGEKDKNHFEFIGVYYYKNYEIFFDHIHEDKRIVKHISIKEMNNKKIKQEDLKFIANHFIGDNYTVQYGVLDNKMANVLEEKVTIN